MKTQLVMLGTAGGPTPKVARSAPAQAITTEGSTYVIDCGNGVARQLIRAGISFDSLRGVFLTHHHSDHNADFGNLFLLAWADNLSHGVDAYGPPPLKEMTKQFQELNRLDIETRIGDEGRPPFSTLIRPHEIMEPGLIHEDDYIRVTAALVRHPPLTHAFGYRFDTADRSIVISGDTTYSPELIELAKGADVLVHEVLYPPALDWIVGRSNGSTLRRHLIESHTSVEEVGKIAQEAGVATLVLSHFVPTDGSVDDDVWHSLASQGYDGEVIVGQDLLVI